MKSHVGKLVVYFVVIAALTTGGLTLPYWFGGSWLPALISVEGKRIDDLFWGLVILSVIILALVMTIVMYSVRHFSVKQGDTDDELEGEPIHGNNRLEVFWTVIPTVIVIVVGFFAINALSTNEEAPAKGKPSMSVFVRGFSFGWKFAYDEKYYTTDQLSKLELSGNGPAKRLPESADLVVPVDTTIKFFTMSCSGEEHVVKQEAEGEERVVSNPCRRRYGKPKKVTVEEDDFIPGQEADVNHSFWVPQARLKIDAVAGLPAWTQWTPDEITGPADHYQVVCAYLCGSGHAAMRTDMCVVSRDVYEWWLTKLTPTESVPCSHIRLFQCVKEKATYDDLDAAAMAAITAKPNAGCTDFKTKIKEQA